MIKSNRSVFFLLGGCGVEAYIYLHFMKCQQRKKKNTWKLHLKNIMIYICGPKLDKKLYQIFNAQNLTSYILI